MFVFQACGPIRGRRVVRGGEIFIRKDWVSKYRLVLIIMALESGSRINASSVDQYRGSKRLSVTQVTFQKVSLVLISIVETSDKEKS